MTKRKCDDKPPPPGGRAAERLREFERARGIEPDQPPPEADPVPADRPPPAEPKDKDK